MTDAPSHTTTASAEIPAVAALPPEIPPRPASPQPARGSGSALSVLALVVGIGALGVGGWLFQQQQQAQNEQQQALSRLQTLQQHTSALQQTEQQIRGTLARLPSAESLSSGQKAIAELQANQQYLGQRVDRVLGASRQEWRLAEAEHLLRLAALRLNTQQDIPSARVLVDTADQILSDHNDPAAFAAREKLAQTREALRQLPTPDRTGLFLQLAALAEQSTALNTRRPEFRDSTTPAPVTANASTWDAWQQRLSAFVRLDFSAQEDVKPLLIGQNLDQVRLAIRLSLSHAQSAALEGRTAVYRQALEQARYVTQHYLGVDDAQNLAFYERLGELARQPISQPVPDLSPALNALQAYLDQRARAEIEALGQHAAPTSAAPKPATEERQP